LTYWNICALNGWAKQPTHWQPSPQVHWWLVPVSGAASPLLVAGAIGVGSGMPVCEATCCQITGSIGCCHEP
jgi:hypothetical protein